MCEATLKTLLTNCENTHKASSEPSAPTNDQLVKACQIATRCVWLQKKKGLEYLEQPDALHPDDVDFWKGVVEECGEAYEHLQVIRKSLKGERQNG